MTGALATAPQSSENQRLTLFSANTANISGPPLHFLSSTGLCVFPREDILVTEQRTQTHTLALPSLFQELRLHSLKERK